MPVVNRVLTNQEFKAKLRARYANDKQRRAYNPSSTDMYPISHVVSLRLGDGGPEHSTG